MTKNLYAKSLVATALLITSSVAQAHYPWILVGNPYPKESAEANIYVGVGHSFPLDRFMEQDRMSSLALITPDGVESPLTSKNALEYNTLPLTQTGVHMIIGTQDKGYFTKTKKGGEKIPKTGLTDVVRCFYSDKSMKSIFNEGPDGILSRSVSHSLEIIPLSNPANLQVGDYMTVQILYRGTPYEGNVFSTYEGFSTEGAYAYTVETDKEGKANIRMLDRGRWLVYARLEQDYPDKNVCDVEAFSSTLTFAIR